ncbi:MAG: pseudouridine synthase [Myxococcota bacterium]|nr:pseudouridine synthase [Myxococcota bacterium]
MEFYGVILNKPPGCVSTRHEVGGRNRPTVYDHLIGWDTPEHRLGHCGRLDFDSSGLLFFTNDGKLTQAMLNHRYERSQPEIDSYDAGVLKLYHVRVEGEVTAQDLEELQQPMIMGGHQAKRKIVTRPAEVRRLKMDLPGTWLEFGLREGRKRQIRRLCKRSKLGVGVLRRMSFGPLELGNLPEGGVRNLTPAEFKACYEVALPQVMPPQLGFIGDIR